MKDIQEVIAEDVSIGRRRKAAMKLVENLATEDIEALVEYHPRAAECSFNDLLEALKN